MAAFTCEDSSQLRSAPDLKVPAFVSPTSPHPHLSLCLHTPWFWLKALLGYPTAHGMALQAFFLVRALPAFGASSLIASTHTQEACTLHYINRVVNCYSAPRTLVIPAHHLTACCPRTTVHAHLPFSPFLVTRLVLLGFKDQHCSLLL